MSARGADPKKLAPTVAPLLTASQVRALDYLGRVRDPDGVRICDFPLAVTAQTVKTLAARGYIRCRVTLTREGKEALRNGK